ncbi:Ammonium transporter 1 member [Seminavis robusta]|uniref:Ammonium transporter 1 member n=1 Tax=Seminavis robusta TaxID=568900 RepID=A0A9N8DN24_9STRA|nr:Ammonium transporter 1 member [Seminavis robusta]|eukprot:Sro169_g074990.1 Ammonium transporter 1 member (439) ;mRNA; f:13800-15400
MLKNLLDAAGAALAYFCFGYGFAFGGDHSRSTLREGASTTATFMGLDNFFGTGDMDLAFFFFQYTFSAATVTIVAGTLAERCQMMAYLCYSLFLTGFVYPIVAHAIWSTHGFLSATLSEPFLGVGVIDFSGSGAVHFTGATTALYAALILGSRRGRFYDVTTGEELEKPKPFPGHSVSLQMLGGFILWFGWYGFNPGTALLLDDNPYQAQIGALCAVNTFLASGGGCVSSLIVSIIAHYRETGDVAFDLMAAMNGSLTGLVSITAGCATLEPWAALVTGLVAGSLYPLGSHLLVRCKIDDAVDAIPVHGFGGSWGLLSVGLLASPERLRQAYGHGDHPGLFYSFASSPDARLLACQICGILFIFGWTLVTMLPFFIWLNFMGWFRTGSIQELVGLDVTYNLNADEEQDLDADDEGQRYHDAYERYRQVMRQEHAKEAD